MNIYDIAKEAGVSIATVSRVLNNKGTVSAATRARVAAICPAASTPIRVKPPREPSAQT